MASELIDSAEAWELDPDAKEDGELRFSHTVVVIRKGTDYYRGCLDSRLNGAKLDVESIQAARIPTSHIWPEVIEGVTVLHHPPEDAYVKQPKLIDYDADGEYKPCDLVRKEAQVCEKLRAQPHRSIAQYHGCIVDGSQIRGLCFKKYTKTLWDRLQVTSEPLDHKAVLSAIQAGIEHIHSLGLAHNDINPANIMFDSDNNAIIVDFDSCLEIGDDLIKHGTHGWCDDENALFSAPARDF